MAKKKITKTTAKPEPEPVAEEAEAVEAVEAVEPADTEPDVSWHEEYMQAARWHWRHGRPQQCRLLMSYVEANTPDADPQLLVTDRDYNTKSEIPAPPPIKGQGSGADNWRAWVKEVTDWDHDIIDSKSRNELQLMLKAEGIMDDDGELL